MPSSQSHLEDHNAGGAGVGGAGAGRVAVGAGVENDDNPLDLKPEILQRLAESILDGMYALNSSFPDRPVSPDTTPSELRSLLPDDHLPSTGDDPLQFIPETVDLLLRHSTFNGHPRFFGYITSSAAPIGALADLLAAGVNPNVGAWSLAPLATEIEAQTIRWLADLIGFPQGCGGLLVSGGNVANVTCALAARGAMATWDLRRHGMKHPDAREMAVYATEEAHIWLEKAVETMGLGTDCIRRVETDAEGRMLPTALNDALARDVDRGVLPMMVVATAGTVSTGTIDPIRAIAAVCREMGVWLHVDGAYGAPAAALPEMPDDLHVVAEADSVALDPHKWLCAPLEAGCVLVRDPADLRDAFSHSPPYYHFDGEERLNYHDWSLQNSRGFRALKVWFILRQLGRSGCEQLIRRNISLSKMLHERAGVHPLLETFAQGLSISTFRFVPTDLRGKDDSDENVHNYLNKLNEELLTELQRGGRVYLSNAVLGGRFVLRTCIVNFRTQESDVQAIPGIIADCGEEVDAALRSSLLAD